HFDGNGRYVYNRTLPIGLKERVVCDGKTLWHLYPELGLAARRTVSRFHREDLAEMVPWALQPAEDLARDFDVKLKDPRTVSLVRPGMATARGSDGKPIPYVEMRLVFDNDSLLGERLYVNMPEGKTQLRVTYSPHGTVKVVDENGKEIAVHDMALKLAEAPDLTPDIKNLIVVPLPYRTRDHVLETLKIK